MLHLSADRVGRTLTSDVNPLMKALAVDALKVREARQPVSPDNPFLAFEHATSRRIIKTLQNYGKARDDMTTHWVNWLYGPFGLGAAFPPAASSEESARVVAKEHIDAAKAEMKPRLASGGFPAGLVRMLLIALRDKGSVRRRSVRLAQLVQHVTDELIANGKLQRVKAPVDWKAVRNEQAKLLALFPEESLATLPRLLANPGERQLACAMVGRVMLVDPEVADPESDLNRMAQEVLGVDFQSAAASEDLPEELLAIRLMQSA
jgi:hypothetical protein